MLKLKYEWHIKNLFTLAAITIFLTVSMGILADHASAQNLSFGKRVWGQGKANCPRCHAWSGLGGVGEDERAPNGANLRDTFFDRDMLEEVIKCGLPGTEMPFFSRRAWEGDNKCFGMTAKEAGNLKPFMGERNLIQREIDALLDYMYAKVIGRGEISVEECEDYFSPGARRCQAPFYRTEEEIAAHGGGGA